MRKAAESSVSRKAGASTSRSSFLSWAARSAGQMAAADFRKKAFSAGSACLSRKRRKGSRAASAAPSSCCALDCVAEVEAPRICSEASISTGAMM